MAKAAREVWTGSRLARIRLRAARTPRTTEEPDGNEGHWRPATDDQAQRGGRGRGPGDWRGSQGTPGEAQRRRGGDPRRDRRGPRGERRGVRPLLRAKGRGITRPFALSGSLGRRGSARGSRVTGGTKVNNRKEPRGR